MSLAPLHSPTAHARAAVEPAGQRDAGRVSASGGAIDAGKLYICPGESYPISRAVHLSRLAAFYPACRDCPLRGDSGPLPPRTLARIDSTSRRVDRGSLVAPEGIRGVFLNELTRTRAGELAGALASLLWDDSPPEGRTGDATAGPRRPGPTVVVGYDERPSSPDLFIGVTDALRRMDCQVIDVATTTVPCFWFSVDHLQASAGIYVTGSGCDPSWIGLDLVLRGAMPMSRGDAWSADDELLRMVDLNRVEDRARVGFSRPTRRAGGERSFRAAIPYEAGLLKHFHALRPLRVCCATPVLQVRRTLDRLFQPLPCRLSHVVLPCRARDLADPRDPDVLALGDAVRQGRAHVGLLIDDDGQRCAFVDERGRLVSPAEVMRLCAVDLLKEHPGAAIVVECGSESEPLRAAISAAGGREVAAGASRAELSLAMRRHQAVFGGGASGRYWFRESFPTSDAILALARMLAVLSRSDAPFSALTTSNPLPTMARDRSAPASDASAADGSTARGADTDSTIHP